MNMLIVISSKKEVDIDTWYENTIKGLEIPAEIQRIYNNMFLGPAHLCLPLYEKLNHNPSANSLRVDAFLTREEMVHCVPLQSSRER